jgi:hypothetical protein
MVHVCIPDLFMKKTQLDLKFPKKIYKPIVLLAKKAFPRLGVCSCTHVGSEPGEKSKAAHLGICGIEAFGRRCWGFLVLARMCHSAALRLGLLLSTLSRLTHIF